MRAAADGVSVGMAAVFLALLLAVPLGAACFIVVLFGSEMEEGAQDSRASEHGARASAPSGSGSPALEPRPSAASATPVAAPREVQVTLVAADGTPVADASVLVEGSDPAEGRATTDAAGRATLATRVEEGVVLARSSEGAWARGALARGATRVAVAFPAEGSIGGTVVDGAGRPLPGARLRLVGVGADNPARSGLVREWAMRSEVGVVVADGSGRFEVRGLASPAVALKPDDAAWRLSEPVRWSALQVPSRGWRVVFVPAAGDRPTASAVVRAVDAVTGDPVAQFAVEAGSAGAPLATEEADGGVRVRWADPSSGPPGGCLAVVTARGYAPATVMLAASPAPVVVRLVRDGTPRLSRLRLCMPAGVRSIVPEAWASHSTFGPADAGGRRHGLATTGHWVNRGAFWDLGPVEPGTHNLSGFLGLEVPRSVEVGEGSVVEVAALAPMWGPVTLRLVAPPQLRGGEFRVAAGPSSAAAVVAEPDGTLDLGWWPAGPRAFLVFRSAEEGTTGTVEVKAAPARNLFDVPLRNLLAD